MDTINSLQIPRLDKIRLSLCRIYLNVLCMSEIADAGETQLLEGMMQGRRDDSRPSTLVWPVQGRPFGDIISHKYLLALAHVY